MVGMHVRKENAHWTIDANFRHQKLLLRALAAV
jgi:hypothetical protein